jgi:hypothetical protein
MARSSSSDGIRQAVYQSHPSLSTAHVIGDGKGQGSWASRCGEGKLQTPAVNQCETCVTIDGAASGETKRRHDITFPLLTLHRQKDRVQDFSKKKTLSIPAILQLFHTPMRS